MGYGTSAGSSKEETEMILIPHTYAEWANILDVFQSGTNDAEVLEAMTRGTVEWQSGVADRFSRRLIDSVNARMNAASDRFQKNVARAGGSEGEIVRALLALRKEMSFLASAIALPALPEKERKYYRQLVIDQANRMQKSLEDSARRDRSGRMASIIRNHRVNTIQG